MNVSDIMQSSVLWVPFDTPVKEVARTIFTTGISGLPVLKDKKLVGIITEEDILSHMYPQTKLMDIPASKIMNNKVVSVLLSTPLSKAEKIMLENKFSRLPVVDATGNLVGIVSQGDIFREVIKDELPAMDKDHYAEFIAENYDMMINWDQRFEEEFPSLLRVFRRDNVKKVLDLGIWTGIFSIGLSQEGVEVTGLENNHFLLKIAQENKAKLSKKAQQNISFQHSDFTNVAADVKGSFDAAISLGNSLLYLPGDTTQILKGVRKVLNDRGLIILQILNTDRVLDKKQRLLNFQIQKAKKGSGQEHLFLEFFDRKDEDTLNHNLVVFDGNKDNWMYKGTTTIPVKYFQEKDIRKMLEDAGFTDISVSGYQSEYQGEYTPISFIKPYDPKTSDWMVVIAKKS